MKKETVISPYIVLTVVCGLAYLLVFAHRFIPAVISLNIKADIGVSHATLGVLTSAYLYVYGFFQFPSGALVDRLGSRPVLIISLFITGVGSILFGLSGSVVSVFVSRVIVGLGCAPILIAGLALLSARVPSGKFPFYSSILYFLGGLGPLIAASPLALLSKAFGWRNACIFIGIFTIFYGLAAFLVFKLFPTGENIGGVRVKKRSEGGVSSLFANKGFLPMLAIGAGAPSIYLVYGGLWAAPYLREVYGYSVELSSAVLSFGAIGAISGFLLAPLVALKLFRSPKMALGVFGLVLAAVLILFSAGFQIPFIGFSFLMFLIGFLSGGSQVVAVIVIKNMFTESVMGRAMGVYNTFPLVFGGLLQVSVGGIFSASVSSVGLKAAYAFGFAPSIIICAFGGVMAFVSLARK